MQLRLRQSYQRKVDQVPCGSAGTREGDDRKKDITLDAQLCFAIYKSSNKIGRLYRQYLQPFDLTFPLYLVLIVLWERAPCNVGDVVQALDLETNSVTPLLKRLQALGYVTRERDSADERKVIIELTNKGHGLREMEIGIRTDFLDRSGVDYDKIIELRSVLHHLSDIIENLMLPKGRARTLGLVDAGQD